MKRTNYHADRREREEQAQRANDPFVPLHDAIQRMSQLEDCMEDKECVECGEELPTHTPAAKRTCVCLCHELT